MNRWGHVTFISAGAGSGKTYRLTEELERALLAGDAAPAGIVGTTFTVKAASELRERVRDRLRAAGHTDLAERTAESLIGTVHSVCERLLRRFAFDLGISPDLNVMSIDDGERFFHQALDQTLDLARVRELNAISHRLGLVDRGVPQWQREVKSIADKARENDMNERCLGAMGERNAENLLRFFGAESAAAPTADLLAAVTAAADMPPDHTKTTEAYRQILVEARTLLPRDDCPWRIWMRLAGENAAKSSRQHSDRVRAVAQGYQGHPAFQRDLREFLCGIYQIAGGAMARFRALKREHGLIDFADLEQFVLHALEKPSVREHLRSEVDLLLVDEFQDTNPMQLALFVKLATLAKRAVFVGDAKQAIYEFRGCDPALVFATLESLAAGEAAKTILANSWRAQPPLLHYLNEVFAAAFSPSTSAVGSLPRESVVLEPQRPPSGGPVVSAWNLAGNAEQRTRAVAEGVFRLVASGARIADPASGAPRPIRYGDIAVLARTNARVERVAGALREMRVPMKMTLLGLLATPEVTLVKSCLRRVADQADTLATAEILALADCAEPEEWLPHRLAWLAAPEANEDIAWREDDHPILRRLAELRADSPLRSPVEIVAKVLNDVDIRRIVAGWGPDDVHAAQRQKNLDAFLNLAVEHEKHAAAHHDPGTLTGFLLWLEHPSSPDLDLQPVVTTGDAVHVLTYHRAKGLEWPLVVCTDFDYEPQLRTWDVRVELPGTFDIEKPLKGREIRYWPNIFGKRRNGVPARRDIEQSAEGENCRERSRAEERRLAYVGLTRARDRLVLALPAKKPNENAWLHSFLADFAIPRGDSLTLPGEVTIATRAETVEVEDAERKPLPYAPRWFAKREPRTHPRKFVRPSDAPQPDGAAIGAILEFGQRIAVRDNEMKDVGSGLHAVFAAELLNPLAEPRAVARAETILAAWRNARVDAADAVAAAGRFHAFLRKRFAPTAMEIEVPILHPLADGRVVRGFVDLLVETADGWLVIDHKSSPQPKSTWRQDALGYAGQLAAYRAALLAAQRKVAGCWVHFAVTGGLVEVRLDGA